MSTITRERLLKIQQWRETYGPGSNVVLPTEEAEELARIALASLEAEPDYIRYDCGCCGWETIEEWRDNDVCPKCNHKPMGKTELFTAPPAPVVPTFDEWLEVRGNKPLGWVKDSMREAYDACRDAMLQVDKSVSTELQNTADLSTNSPVIPDCWIKCNERMPDKGQRVLVFVDFDSMTVSPIVKDASVEVVIENGKVISHG